MDKIDNAAAVNLSTGKLTSFIEFAGMAAELLGYRPQVRGLSSQPTGVFARGGDTTLQRQLGFTHTIDFAQASSAPCGILPNDRVAGRCGE